MAYDAKDYELVQTGPATWGVQYKNGPFVGGLTSRDDALQWAQTRATDPVSGGSAPNETSPRNIDEATSQADMARKEYRQFLDQNPKADVDSRRPYEDRITQADAHVSNFTAQQEYARSQATSPADFASMNRAQQIGYADQMRQERSQEALQARKHGKDAATIAEADARAFEAEDYYQKLVQDDEDISRPTSFSLGSLMGGLGIAQNLVGQALSPINNVLNQVNGAISSVTGVLGGTGRLLNNVDNFLATGGSNTMGSGGSNSPTVTNNAVSGGSSGGKDLRVRITPKPALRNKVLTGLLAPLKDTGGLVFPYTPTIQIQAGANYNALMTVHANQDWHIYQNTPSVELNINGPFTAQNKTEGEYLLASLHFLRTLTKMHFGENDPNQGLPPPQVLLDGYGTYMFNGLSIIVKSYNMEFPNNVDYLEVEYGGGVTKVPVVTNITVQCIVQNTPKKNREFDWDKFASGELMKGGRWF